MSLLRAEPRLSQNSYYAATVTRGAPHVALESNLDCDVAVVGGGLAGLSAAIELAERGFHVVLLEAREIGWGASGRNGGQLIAGLACDPETIEMQLGLATAKDVWAMTLEALAIVQERRERFAIDCDWQPGFIGAAVNARKAAALRPWQARMQEVYGYDTRWIPPADMPQWIASPRFHSGYFDPLGGHLHPLKYTLGLARAAERLGVRLFEASPVTAIEPGPRALLKTPRGTVRAAHVLLAGNVYLQGVAPLLSRRIMPVGTYIVASAPLEEELARSLVPTGSAVCDTNFVLDYFRPTVDRRMLYGGRVSYSTATPANLATSMQHRMSETFAQLRDAPVEFAWGGFVDISMNRAPDFGRLPDAGASPDFKNVYYVQGFSGHGLALTGLAGRVVAEAMAGDARRLDVFARLRHRNFPGGTLLRTPALVAAMAYYRLKDLL